MEKEEDQDDLIWRYLDDDLTEFDKTRFESQIEQNTDLKTRLDELNRLNDYTKKNILRSPVSDFTEHLMLHIQGVRIVPKRSHWVLLAGLLVTLFISGLYLSEYSSNITLELNKIDIPESPIKIPSVDLKLNEKLPLDQISKGLLYTLSILSLLFFDRAILRPYFKGRKATN